MNSVIPQCLFNETDNYVVITLKNYVVMTLRRNTSDLYLTTHGRIYCTKNELVFFSFCFTFSLLLVSRFVIFYDLETDLSLS